MNKQINEEYSWSAFQEPVLAVYLQPQTCFHAEVVDLESILELEIVPIETLKKIRKLSLNADWCDPQWLTVSKLAEK